MGQFKAPAAKSTDVLTVVVTFSKNLVPLLRKNSLRHFMTLAWLGHYFNFSGYSKIVLNRLLSEKTKTLNKLDKHWPNNSETFKKKSQNLEVV